MLSITAGGSGRQLSPPPLSRKTPPIMTEPKGEEPPQKFGREDETETEGVAVSQILLRACAGGGSILIQSGPKRLRFAQAAEGAFSRVFSCAFKSAKIAVKFNKGADDDVTGLTPLIGVAALEADATLVAWYMVSRCGISPHVLRPYAVLPFRVDMSPYGLPSGVFSVPGLVTEFLNGIPSTTGGTVTSMGDFIAAGAAGGIPDFPAALRVVVFQVLFTLAMWAAVCHGGHFRHNDLHMNNVCVKQWKEENAVVRYNVVAKDGSRRAFVVPTNGVCAVVVDFGYAAVLKAMGGTRHDPRFYKDGVRPAKTREHMLDRMGMSHRQPSQHYDAVLFLSTIYQALERVCKSKHACAPVREAQEHFRGLFSRTVGNLYAHHCIVVENRKKSDPSTVTRKNTGRLQWHAQRQLETGALVAPTPVDMLVQDPYFAPFRARKDACAKMTFGLGSDRPVAPVTAEVVDPKWLTQPTAIARLPIDRYWRPQTCRRTGKLHNPPCPGNMEYLLHRVDQKRSRCINGHDMSDSDEMQWVHEHVKL